MKLIAKDIIDGFSHYSGKEEPVSAGLEAESDIQFNSPLQVEVDVTREGNTFYLKGDVDTVITMTCARCLCNADICSSGSFEGVFTWKQTSTPFLEISDESDLHKFGGSELDLGPLIREAVLMSVPIAPLCRQDCLGLCPKCGSDLNKGKCSCEIIGVDPRWLELKSLKPEEN